VIELVRELRRREQAQIACAHSRPDQVDAAVGRARKAAQRARHAEHPEMLADARQPRRVWPTMIGGRAITSGQSGISRTALALQLRSGVGHELQRVRGGW